MLNKNTIVSQSKEINATELDDEIVMMNIQKGKYFALNSVGSSIWEKINDKITIEDLINNIEQEYDVNREECENCVINFLEKLQENNLIEVYN